MNLLLDTHALIWFFNGDRRLSENARYAIESADNRKLISIASLWEMALKVSIGRLKFSMGFRSFLNLIEENGFEIVPLDLDHFMALSQLEFKHRDPFDRMMVAQCLSDSITFVTKDDILKHYDVKILW